MVKNLSDVLNLAKSLLKTTKGYQQNVPCATLQSIQFGFEYWFAVGTAFAYEP